MEILHLNMMVTKVKDKTAGRVPQDALLFIQAAIKSKQKGPFSCGGHGIRGRRCLFSPVQQLTGWRLRSTEGQGPQLNKFRWAGFVRRCSVGSGGGDNEIFPNAGPGLLPGSRFPSTLQRRCLQRGGSITGAPPPWARANIEDALPVQCANGPKSQRFPAHTIGR